MILACAIVLSAYIAAIALLIFGFVKMADYRHGGLKPKTRFSIVVPFRNEAENLPHLLQSFSQLDYPHDLFEVVLVDDDSHDGFEIGSYGFITLVTQNIRTSGSPKKDAIKTAVAIAKNDWIITTDADCTVNAQWLRTFDDCIQRHRPEMIAGAVRYKTGNSFLEHFQQLELASLQGATIGSFALGKAFMCNGANFAYSKQCFSELKGFDANDDVASGDDVFLLQQAMERFPEKVFYLKSGDNTVTTQAAKSWKELFHQRVRWAAKAGSYNSGFGKTIGIMVLFGNLGWLTALFAILFYGFPALLLLLLLLKITVDFVLIRLANRFLKCRTRSFLVASLLYPVFSWAVAVYPAFGKFEWKGRRFGK